MAITWGPPDTHDLGGWTVDDTTPDQHSSVVFLFLFFCVSTINELIGRTL